MNFDDLQNPELQEKVKACKTPEEVLALAKEEGYELTEGVGKRSGRQLVR